MTPVQKKAVLFKAIDAGKASISEVQKLDRELKKRACHSKLKLTPEEAAARIWRYTDPNTSIYLCECGYCHFGHPSEWVREATRIIKAKIKASKGRSRTKKPKWMNDPRRYAG